MESLTATVADIQHCSIHDGPGIRTTVFFKGCPLSCRWCHNPECISREPQVLSYPEKCIGCGKCAEGCFSGAKVLCGREMSAAEILDEIKRDIPYYGREGGVTLSGGEPLLRPDFCAELFGLCGGISRAVETSLVTSWESALPVLSLCDVVMCDLKIFDGAKHREYTGADNSLIKENLRRLSELGIPFILRTPVVGGINDTEAEISAIAEFAAGLQNLMYYELLPYHPLGLSKAKALGIEAERFETPSKERMAELRHAAASRHIKVKGENIK